jgi:septum formation protein
LKNSFPEIILASNSERRKYLLTEMGFDFIQVPSSAIELGKDSYFAEVATVNAFRKAVDIARKNPDSLVIGADTVIETENEIIGKPVSIKDAKDILRKLSNKSHFVVSGVSIQSINANIRCTFAVSTKVHFKELTDKAINEYLSHVDVMDKAGAYAIQEYGEMLVKSIEGPLDNVIGLPCEELKEALEAIISCLN